jgi:multisubunit Na+/H+ antiporter MnhF subunit
MTVVAFVLLSIGAMAFLTRLLLGPSLPDRVIALDGLASTVTVGVIVAAARTNSGFEIDIVLVIALVGFVGTGVLARFVERRGS